jgi:hypothetical protein
MPALGVGACRCLLGDLDALFDERPIDVSLEIEPTSYRSGRR